MPVQQQDQQQDGILEHDARPSLWSKTSHDSPRSEFYDEELEAAPERLGAVPAVPPNAPLLRSAVDSPLPRRLRRQRVSARHRMIAGRSMVSDIIEADFPLHTQATFHVPRSLKDDSKPLFMRAYASGFC